MNDHTDIIALNRSFDGALERFLCRDAHSSSTSHNVESEPRPRKYEELASKFGMAMYARPADAYSDVVYRNEKSAFSFRCDGDFLAGIINDNDEEVQIILYVDCDRLCETQELHISIPPGSFYKLPLFSFLMYGNDQSFTFQIKHCPQILRIPKLRFVFGICSDAIFDSRPPYFEIKTDSYFFTYENGHLRIRDRYACKD